MKSTTKQNKRTRYTLLISDADRAIRDGELALMEIWGHELAIPGNPHIAALAEDISIDLPDNGKDLCFE